MKTITTLKENLQKSVLFILFSAITIIASARTVSVGITPAKPSSFTAVLNNKKVDLKWSTETETDLSHFIVERSVDGINFSDAALVFAYGNTTSRSNYVFADNISKLQSDIIYYRISTISTDGKNQFSDVIIIRTNESAK